MADCVYSLKEDEVTDYLAYDDNGQIISNYFIFRTYSISK